MSVTKVMLRGYGLSDEQVQAIIDGHMESVTGLQAEVEKYKAECETAEKNLAKVQKELNTFKETAEKDAEKNPYKEKYEAVKAELDAFKKEVDAKAVKASKSEAYKELLHELGVYDKHIKTILKAADTDGIIDGIEFDENGKIKNSMDLKNKIKETWAVCIPTEGAKGANTSNPPSNTGGNTMTKEEIRKISDPVARQKAMAENPSLFGLQ